MSDGSLNITMMTGKDHEMIGSGQFALKCGRFDYLGSPPISVQWLVSWPFLIWCVRCGKFSALGVHFL